MIIRIRHSRTKSNTILQMMHIGASTYGLAASLKPRIILIHLSLIHIFIIISSSYRAFGPYFLTLQVSIKSAPRERIFFFLHVAQR